MQSLEASEKWQLHRVVALWFLFLLLLPFSSDHVCIAYIQSMSLAFLIALGIW